MLVAAVLLAGCSASEPAGQAAPTVVTDPTDYSYVRNAGPGAAHVHDYWGGQQTLQVLDATRGSTWNTVGGSGWKVSFFPPENRTVPQGTAELTIQVDWQDLPMDGAPPNAYGDVSLWVQPADANEPRFVQLVQRGDTVRVPVAYEEADLPHQLVSAWEFVVQYNASSLPYSAFFGSTSLVVEAHRGLELRPFPPHPDRWGNATQLPLADEAGRHFWVDYTGTGNLPRRIGNLEGAVVPLGASHVEVVLEHASSLPAGSLVLQYHGADTRAFQRLAPDEEAPGRMVYRIPVTDRTADGPYSNETLWEFLLDTPNATEPQPALYDGTYRIVATVRAVFMFNTMLVGVPTGIKVFNWLATMWGGQINLRAPMKYCLGFIWLFVIGGITGVMLGAIPVDYHLHDSYFVVAHFHYTMVGGAVFGIFAGVYYWYPFLSGGRMYNERLANWHFWTMFVGFNLTFFPQFLMALTYAMPRRVYDYQDIPALVSLNQMSTVGAFLIGFSILIFLVNVAISWRTTPRTVRDPWGGARHIEWKLWEEGRVVHGEGLILDREPVPLAAQREQELRRRGEVA